MLKTKEFTMNPTTSKELSHKAYELGFSYEKELMGCAQCVIAALQDALKIRNTETDAIFKAATGLAGGVARQTDGNCGAYAGAAMIIGYHLGRERDNFADPEKIRMKNFDLVKKLHSRFIEEFGTVTCREIHTRIMGRPFFIEDPDEFAKFEAAGAHADKCTRVVALAAQWCTEILAEADLIQANR